MTGPTYDQILEIMRRTMAEVTNAGHDLKLCVWELSPSIVHTLHSHFIDTRQMVEGKYAAAFMGIPIRLGVTNEGTGILLKRVNLHPWE